MRAVDQRQRLRPDDIIHCQLAVEMRKLRPATRDFPFERIVQTVCLEREQEQPVHASKMFGRSLGDLPCSREVDIAVGHVDGRACCLTRCTQGLPFVGTENFKYKHGLCDAAARGRGQGRSTAQGCSAQEDDVTQPRI